MRKSPKIAIKPQIYINSFPPSNPIPHKNLQLPQTANFSHKNALSGTILLYCMGMACGCARRTDNVVCSEPTSGRPQALNALKHLGELYHNSVLSPKLKPYFQRALEGSSAEITRFTLKLSRLGLKDLESLAQVLPFYAEVTELQLWKVGLSGHRMDLLRSALDSLVDITVLALEDNCIDDPAALSLSRRLEKWTNLKEIWLPANDLTAKGICCIMEALQCCRQVEVLSLAYNDLGTPGSAVVCKFLLSRSPLRLLSLENNEISSSVNSGLESLGRLNPPLERTDLRCNLFTDAECAQLRTEFGAAKVCVKAQRPPLLV